MTQLDPAPGPELPAFVTQLAASAGRHAMTLLAGVLAAKGLATSDFQTQLIQFGGAAAVALVAFVWSAIQKRDVHKVLGR